MPYSTGLQNELLNNDQRKKGIPVRTNLVFGAYTRIKHEFQLFLLSTLTLLSCRGEEPIDRTVSFEEKLLGTIPPQVNIVSNDDVVFSPDGRSVAYSAEEGRKRFIVINNTRQPEYDWVDRPVFSSDGRKVAYVSVTDIDWKRWLDPTVPNFQRGGKWFVIDDGKKIGPYDYAWLVSHRPDGNQIAFAAMAGDRWMVVNGEDSGESFDWVGVPVFSHDGRIAYQARLGKAWFVVIDSQKGPAYDEVGDPVWSPDGKIAYAAKKGRKWYAVVNRQTDGPFDYVRAIAFRKDGTPAFIGHRKRKAFLVTGQKEEGPFDDVLSFIFSVDGSAVAYEVRKGNSSFAVFDTLRFGPFRTLAGIGLSANGKRFAYVTYDGSYHLVLDGETIKETSDMPIKLEFNPDGKDLAYILVGDEDKSLGINSSSTSHFDDVRTFVFSPDGKKIGFGARMGNELWWKVTEAGRR